MAGKRAAVTRLCRARASVPPAWRGGPRDYWRIETETGERLWIFEERGGAAPGGLGAWFLHGVFA